MYICVYLILDLNKSSYLQKFLFLISFKDYKNMNKNFQMHTNILKIYFLNRLFYIHIYNKNFNNENY